MYICVSFGNSYSISMCFPKRENGTGDKTTLQDDLTIFSTLNGFYLLSLVVKGLVLGFFWIIMLLLVEVLFFTTLRVLVFPNL